ncbi:RdRP-domain-containing protein [Sistotremastrum niveocremeum HHB9708]|uniref:RNA-dependent RNA polymerase n=1 Tax=Sistotremastrum niveocremeum HHB9708 TaxID=1314777 RepID=A0A164YL41_9AGAM|nr:RdRP-domain-containing protein [Sistotremastrum niveocremeum HHB9708]
MEIYLPKVPANVSEANIVRALEGILHKPPFTISTDRNQPHLLNFNLRLFPDKRGLRSHRGMGCITFPTARDGTLFLSLYGRGGSQSFIVKENRIECVPSRKPPLQHILKEITGFPYQNPLLLEKQRKLLDDLSTMIPVDGLEFGWESSHEFSAEWDSSGSHESLSLTFRPLERELEIEMHPANTSSLVQRLYSDPFSGLQDAIQSPTHWIVIPYNYIQWIGAKLDGSSSFLFLSLETPPRLEERSLPFGPLKAVDLDNQIKRTRIHALDEKHANVAPYAMLAIRLICHEADVQQFSRMAKIARITMPQRTSLLVRRMSYFSPQHLNLIDRWLSTISWPVAFQCLGLLHNHILNTVELLSLHGNIMADIQTHGTTFTQDLVKQFGVQVCDSRSEERDISSIWSHTRALALKRQISEHTKAMRGADPNLFQCWHVVITPTAFKFDGPYTDRSNRVLRLYQKHQSHFLRVSFEDEARLHLRFDHKVDNRRVIDRVGERFLKKGLTLAGRHFEFLAFSMSALHEHTVWFMSPFRDDSTSSLVTTSLIRKELGVFDKNLMRCPARYAARMSQAFTATDSAIELIPGEACTVEDVKCVAHGKSYEFTDGVGYCSPELGRRISVALSAKKNQKMYNAQSSVYQIRYGGAKGMISIKQGLPGNILCIRPSMQKFEAPNCNEVEIAGVFMKPSPMFLNRFLIMILEGLDVPCSSFLRLQRSAVQDVRDAKSSLSAAAALLEAHGLGAVFRLPSILIKLAKAGFQVPQRETSHTDVRTLDDPFLQRALDFAENHALREMKYRARIPVPGSWNLVGVVDEYDQLQPGQISCITQPDVAGPVFLEGQMLISRSPQIHPGDVRLVTAIGRPPPGSPLESHPLLNCIVFACRGGRPLPSCLGGGDLDGDTYIISPLPDLMPTRKVADPGAYLPAPKRLIDSDASINDIADFVCDFIANDRLGIIATSWLKIADQTRDIFHEDCLKLAQLHSDAVDFQKSGTPVDLMKIPRPQHNRLPDWSAPEGTDISTSTKYYESLTAVGILFRDISLPIRTREGRDTQMDTGDDVVEKLGGLYIESNNQLDDPVSLFLATEVKEFMVPWHEVPEVVWSEILASFNSYAAQLRYSCQVHTLSGNRRRPLTEEEALIGTIIAKAYNHRIRDKQIARLREDTQHIIQNLRDDMDAKLNPEWNEGERLSLLWKLDRWWTAWRLSRSLTTTFGARSFGWIALGTLFNILDSLHES